MNGTSAARFLVSRGAVPIGVDGWSEVGDCSLPLPLPLPQLVRSAHHDHTLACLRSEPISLCDLGLTRSPAERGLPLRCVSCSAHLQVGVMP